VSAGYNPVILHGETDNLEPVIFFKIFELEMPSQPFIAKKIWIKT
tara:strand:- start:316 stop:450 length:135 start_codon:yes stop_codon:yes gene_type:complete